MRGGLDMSGSPLLAWRAWSPTVAVTALILAVCVACSSSGSSSQCHDQHHAVRVQPSDSAQAVAARPPERQRGQERDIRSKFRHCDRQVECQCVGQIDPRSNQTRSDRSRIP